jgi:hypothetical protein
MPSAMGWWASSSVARLAGEAAHRGVRSAVVVALLALQACVAVPRTTQVYDEGCRIHARQMVLEIEQVGAIGGCVNQGCVALLVAAGVITAASVVVSGSIVIAGNVAYWFEKQGQCQRQP